MPGLIYVCDNWSFPADIAEISETPGLEVPVAPPGRLVMKNIPGTDCPGILK